MKHKVTRYNIFEYLDILQTLETRNEKIEFMRRYQTKEIIWFFKVMFEENNLTTTKVPEYTPCIYDPGCTYKSVISDLRLLEGMFNGRFDVNEEKYRRKLLLVLENVPAGDAKYLEVLIKRKTIKGITRRLVGAAFPQYFPDIVKTPGPKAKKSVETLK